MEKYLTFLLFAIEMATLSVFLMKNGLGTLGVKFTTSMLLLESVHFIQAIFHPINFFIKFIMNIVQDKKEST